MVSDNVYGVGPNQGIVLQRGVEGDIVYFSPTEGVGRIWVTNEEEPFRETDIFFLKREIMSGRLDNKMYDSINSQGVTFDLLQTPTTHPQMGSLYAVNIKVNEPKQNSKLGKFF